jgi:ketosteroid isomerase-like protein
VRNNSLFNVLPGNFCKIALPLLLLGLLTAPAWAVSEDEILIAMLDDFLAGASGNDIAAHQRFWSDDLVYTSSTGERFGKADIIKSMQDASAAKSDEPAMVYGREALLVRVYGDTAVVTFRLTGTRQSETPAVTRFYNTGTFLKRDGEWRVIAWQATRIPDDA